MAFHLTGQDYSDLAHLVIDGALLGVGYLKLKRSSKAQHAETKVTVQTEAAKLQQQLDTTATQLLQHISTLDVQHSLEVIEKLLGRKPNTGA